MHLIVPFAAPLSEPGRAALRTLALPTLAALLKRLHPAQRDDADEWALSPPHERALARAFGWRGGAGQLPFAARAAAADGIAPGQLAWGLLTPVHWHLGTEQLSLLDPAGLQLDEAASRAFFDAVSPLFTSLGWVVRWGAPLRWYVAHESLADLPAASLDRVIGRNVDPWLGEDPAARALRRLQMEVQMLLHAHPLNEEREARGLPTVNSFWLSGCGVAQPADEAAARMVDDLRAPALAEDWPAWQRAWAALDACTLAELDAALQRGEDVALTLCGERSGVTLRPLQGWWSGLRARLASPAARPLLESL